MMHVETKLPPNLNNAHLMLSVAKNMAGILRFPLSYQRLVGVKVSQRFREAVEVRSATVTQSDIGPRDLLIRNRFVGVNASDINVTAGIL